MKQRIITGVVMTAIGIPILWFSDYFVFPLAVAVFCIVATFEMLRVHGHQTHWILAVPGYVLAGAMPVGVYLWRRVFFLDTERFFILALSAFSLYFIYLMFVAVLAQGDLSFGTVSAIFASVFYVISAFTAISLLRYMENGLLLIILVCLCAWVCDIFAYFVGTLIGKHKLVEKLSPKKTIEGSVGGIVFSLLSCLLYGFILQTARDMAPNYLVLAVCGVLLSVVSQVGDLFASLIKREYGVKDYGTIFPGHGGVMDRFDSVLAVALVLLAVCTVAPPLR